MLHAGDAESHGLDPSALVRWVLGTVSIVSLVDTESIDVESGTVSVPMFSCESEELVSEAADVRVLTRLGKPATGR
jgi:hypothetical protein